MQGLSVWVRGWLFHTWPSLMGYRLACSHQHEAVCNHRGVTIRVSATKQPYVGNQRVSYHRQAHELTHNHACRVYLKLSCLRNFYGIEQDVSLR